MIRIGIEPGMNVPRQISQRRADSTEKLTQNFCLMVPETGIEPVRPL
jgi:hypothetical protein